MNHGSDNGTVSVFIVSDFDKCMAGIQEKVYVLKNTHGIFMDKGA